MRFSRQQFHQIGHEHGFARISLYMAENELERDEDVLFA